MSTMTTYSHYIHWSDAVERGVMQHALENGESVSIVALTKESSSLISRVARSVFDYMVSVTRALDEARLRDARMSACYW